MQLFFYFHLRIKILYQIRNEELKILQPPEMRTFFLVFLEILNFTPEIVIFLKTTHISY